MVTPVAICLKKGSVCCRFWSSEWMYVRLASKRETEALANNMSNAEVRMHAHYTQSPWQSLPECNVLETATEYPSYFTFKDCLEWGLCSNCTRSVGSAEYSLYGHFRPLWDSKAKWRSSPNVYSLGEKIIELETAILYSNTQTAILHNNCSSVWPFVNTFPINQNVTCQKCLSEIVQNCPWTKNNQTGNDNSQDDIKRQLFYKNTVL